MAEAICGILVTACLDICAGICFDIASTRKIFSKFLLHIMSESLPYTNTPQAARVQNTFSLVHVVDAWATRMFPSDNLWLMLTLGQRGHNPSATLQCKSLINNAVIILVCSIFIVKHPPTPKQTVNPAADSLHNIIYKLTGCYLPFQPGWLYIQEAICLSTRLYICFSSNRPELMLVTIVRVCIYLLPSSKFSSAYNLCCQVDPFVLYSGAMIEWIIERNVYRAEPFINTPSPSLLQVAWDVSWLSDVLLSWTICIETWKPKSYFIPQRSAYPITSDFVSSHPLLLLRSHSNRCCCV